MTEILDSQGNTVRVGMRTLENDGTVGEITDPDGDTNSYGRTVGIAPRVTVFYDDNTIDTYTTTWNATGPWDDHRDDYTCDDITVIVDTDVNGDEDRYCIVCDAILRDDEDDRCAVHQREPDGQRMTKSGRIVPTDR